MGFLDRLSHATDRIGAAVVKTNGTLVIPSAATVGVAQTPPEVAASMDAQGMNSNTPLGPGRPINPAFGYNEQPRQFDYRVGQNINNRPRQTERVSFGTIRQLVETYDIAQLCISHRISSVRGLPWKITPAKGYELVDLDAQIDYATRLMEKPDGSTPFDSWLAQYVYDVLAFDAGCLYRQRDGFGNVIGLEVIDGTTIAPMIDEYGRIPESPATAYKQFVQGLGTIDLDRDHLIYQPFQPISNSLYGRAPIETILLNANTDIRLQVYLMQRFTEGNIPSMLAMAPETWTPDQIREFQDSWDAWLLGDQAAKSQIKWIPGGTKVQETHDANTAFNDPLADRLMRKTAAAFHVTPTDLGFTDKSNRSTGESQESVQERIADIPLTGHLAGIVTRFFREDLGLPLTFQFLLNTNDEDSLAQAQADKIYVDMGAVSVSYIAQERFGKTDDPGEQAPRYVMTTRGPVPLSNLFASSTRIDAATEAPEGVIPAHQTSILDVVPSVEQTATAPSTAAPAAPEAAAKAELAKFTRYLDARVKRGRGWRDFEFEQVPERFARELNRAGRSETAKADGEVNVAGLVVMAADTGRVLMLQRALDPADPNAGLWEFPGGHLEGVESPWEAACREWQEETGCLLPVEGCSSYEGWESGNYAGFVYLVMSESQVPCRIDSTSVLNPDDPDGDNVETVAWWEPKHLAGNPAVRPELAQSLPAVFAALQTITAAAVARVDGLWKADAACSCCLGSGEHETGMECYACDASGLAAAVGGRVVPCDGAAVVPPFVRKGWRDMAPKVPQHRYDVALTDYWAARIRDSVRSWLGSLPLDGLLAQVAKGAGDDYAAALRVQPGYRSPGLSDVINGMYADGYAAGQHAGAEQVHGLGISVQGVAPAVSAFDWDSWEPGNPWAADLAADGGLADLLDAAGITIRGIEGTLLDDVGNTIAGGLADGLGVRDIRNLLLDTVGDLARAERIAHTESTRAVIAATLGLYGANGIREWDLITSDGACARCLAIEAANPHAVGDGQEPPEHPFCRCATAPRTDSIVAVATETEE